ncbi:trigger factor [Chloroflexota bacterium]
MKIESELQEDHQIKLTVEIESEVFKSSKQRASKKIAKQVKIPGFRPGKAPYNVVARQVGEPAIIEEAIDILLDDIYPKIIEKTEISPYGPGSLQNIVSMEPPVFEFMVPLAPEVTLGDFRQLRLEYQPKEVSEEDIENVIDNLRANQAVIEPADRAAKEGDMVYIILTGERENAKDEEEKTLVEERKFPVVIEKKETDDSSEWPFPGFSQELIGLKAEDEKILNYKFPKDYEFDELSGVKAAYAVKVEEIKARILPDVNDEFAQSVGEYETVEEMRKDIQENLSTRFQSESKSAFEDEIIQSLVDQSEFKYPPQMLENEIEFFVNDLSNRLQNQGMDMDLYLKSRDMQLEGLHEEIRPNAEERIKRSLILIEVAEQEEINITSEEIEEKAQQTLAQFQQAFTEEQAKKFSASPEFQNLLNQIITNEITNRTLELLGRIAKGEPIEKEEDQREVEESAEEKPEKPAEEEKEATETSQE